MYVKVLRVSEIQDLIQSASGVNLSLDELFELRLTVPDVSVDLELLNQQGQVCWRL